MGDSDETKEFQEKYWSIGLAIALIGSLIGALGDNMVRMEYVKAGPHTKSLDMFKRWRFNLGFFMTTVMDCTCTFAALVFAPATVVIPFAGVHIFWNIFLAKFWLGETVGFYEYLGSGAVITGIVLIVVFAGKQTAMSIQEVGYFLSTTQSIVYISVLVVLIGWSILFATDFGAKRLPTRFRKHIQRFSVAAVSGLIGGNTNLAAKAVSLVVVAIFASDFSVFLQWGSYVAVLLTVCLALTQLVYLNIGLRRYEAIYIVPTINSFLMGTGGIGGVMILQEYPENWAGFFVGIVLAIAGILLLTIKHTSGDWAKMTSRNWSLEADVVPGIPSEGKVSISSMEVLSPSNNGVAIPPLISTTIYRQISQQLSTTFNCSMNSISASEVVLSPQALHCIQNMQESHLPERGDSVKPDCGASSDSGSTESISSSSIAPLSAILETGSNRELVAIPEMFADNATKAADTPRSPKDASVPKDSLSAPTSDSELEQRQQPDVAAV